MEPWQQILDVDDSDLLPLRRCKQQRHTNHNHNQTISITTTSSTSQSQTLDSSPSPSQTVNSLSQNLTPANQAESPPQSRIIPGPAGIVQAAKLRKARDIVNCVGQEEDQPMATQEYIRKAIEDPKEDEGFNRNPWLSAVEFACAEGMFGSGSGVRLGEISKCQRNGKLFQVCAVIKSCTPNELGDMTVTLKDPTGSVSGTIHHKVLAEGDFRRDICAGSVLILHNVSVFSPSRSTHYLNITKRNLVKVFYKDGGSSEQQTFHGTINATPHSDSAQGTPMLDGGPSQRQTFYGTIDATPHSDLVQGTPTLGGVFSLERGAEEITNRLKRRNKNNEQVSINHSQTNNQGTNMNNARDKETLIEAGTTEKGQNVGQLSERFTNGFNGPKASAGCWTDEQVKNLEFLDDY